MSAILVAGTIAIPFGFVFSLIHGWLRGSASARRTFWWALTFGMIVGWRLELDSRTYDSILIGGILGLIGWLLYCFYSSFVERDK